MSILTGVSALLAIVATAFALITALALWRAPDALSRANVLSIMGGVVLPLLVTAKLLRDWSVKGFDPNDTVRAVLAILGLLVVASISSFYLGRSIYGVSSVDPRIKRKN